VRTACAHSLILKHNRNKTKHFTGAAKAKQAHLTVGHPSARHAIKSQISTQLQLFAVK